MKRIRLVGLCLVAAFAVAAIAASSAFAGEYGFCVAKKKGRYSDPGCTQPAARKGHWEWIGADSCYPMKKGRYAEGKCATLDLNKKGKPKGAWELAPSPTYGDSSGQAVLKIPGVAKITCSGSESDGEVTGPFTDKDTVLFVGCRLRQPSGSEAQCSVHTFPLLTELIDHETLGLSELEPKEGEVWTEYFAEKNEADPEALIAIISCPEIDLFVAVRGSLSGVTTPTGVMTAGPYSIAFAAGVGEQDLVAETNSQPMFGPGSGAAGPFPAVEEITGAKVTYSQPIEIRPCNELEPGPVIECTTIP
jgi:hypothetical protein